MEEFPLSHLASLYSDEVIGLVPGAQEIPAGEGYEVQYPTREEQQASIVDLDLAQTYVLGSKQEGAADGGE